jgi:hypothetical protein
MSQDAPKTVLSEFLRGLKAWSMLVATLGELFAFLLNELAVSDSTPVPTRGSASPKTSPYGRLPSWSVAALGYRYMVALFFCFLASVYCLRGKHLTSLKTVITKKVSIFKLPVGETSLRIYEKVPWLLLLLLILFPLATTVLDVGLFLGLRAKQDKTTVGWSLWASLAAGSLSLLAFLLNCLEQHRSPAKPPNQRSDSEASSLTRNAAPIAGASVSNPPWDANSQASIVGHFPSA